MTSSLKKAWDGFVRPMLGRPAALQVAALCYRERDGNTEVLLISSRDTGRWIIPKGWPMDGLDAAEAAAQEAWEEAGVRPKSKSVQSIGSFEYVKRLNSGTPLPCTTLVFPFEVQELANDFPEKGERSRQWLAPAKAAEIVSDAGLAKILRAI